MSAGVQRKPDTLHAFHVDQMHIRISRAAERTAAERRERRGIRDQHGPVDQEQRLAVDLQIARIGGIRDGIGDHRVQCPPVVLLFEDQRTRAAVPVAGPVFIGPAHAIRKVDIGIADHRLEWLVQRTATTEISQ
jgi:hypothetical protein